MTNLAYKAGKALEYAARHYLEDNGYFVITSAGSKGKADLVAIKKSETLLVQCKTDGYLLPAEMKGLYELAELVGAVAIGASWHKEGRAARTVEFRRITELAGRSFDSLWTPDYAIPAYCHYCSAPLNDDGSCSQSCIGVGDS